jgi:hypothetical protein
LELNGEPPQVMVDRAAVEQQARVAQEHMQLPIDADAEEPWKGQGQGHRSSNKTLNKSQP